MGRGAVGCYVGERRGRGWGVEADPSRSVGEQRGGGVWMGWQRSNPSRSVGERRGRGWVLVGLGVKRDPSHSVGERRGPGWGGGGPGDRNGPLALCWGAEGDGLGSWR